MIFKRERERKNTRTLTLTSSGPVRKSNGKDNKELSVTCKKKKTKRNHVRQCETICHWWNDTVVPPGDYSRRTSSQCSQHDFRIDCRSNWLLWSDYWPCVPLPHHIYLKIHMLQQHATQPCTLYSTYWSEMATEVLAESFEKGHSPPREL